jgi:hypothetical protein
VPSARRIAEQQTEIGRLAAAIRELRAAQITSQDPRQVERLGAVLDTFRERVALASETLGILRGQREELTAAARALLDFRVATLAGKAALLVQAGGAAGRLPGAALQGLAGAAGSAVGAITGMARAVGAFVEASNPGEMLRFNMAVRDLMAAFGRVFEPVIMVLTEFANVLNQFVTSLQPVLGPLVKQLANAFLQIAKALLDVLAPIIESLIPVFQFLADVVLPPIVAVFRVLAEAVRAVINWFRSLVGLDPLARASDNTGQRTVAARQAQQIGIEQIGEQARAAAFGSASAAERQVALAERNNQLAERGNSLLEQIAANIGPAGRGAAEWVGRRAAAAIDGVVGMFG